MKRWNDGVRRGDGGGGVRVLGQPRGGRLIRRRTRPSGQEDGLSGGCPRESEAAGRP